MIDSEENCVVHPEEKPDQCEHEDDEAVEQDTDDSQAEHLAELIKLLVHGAGCDLQLRQSVEVPGTNGALLKGWPTTNAVRLYIYGQSGSSVAIDLKRLLIGTERGSDNAPAAFRNQTKVLPKYDEQNHLISVLVVSSSLTVTMSPETFDDVIRKGVAMQLAMLNMISPSAAIKGRRDHYQQSRRRHNYDE